MVSVLRKPAFAHDSHTVPWDMANEVGVKLGTVYFVAIVWWATSLESAST